MLKKLLTVLLTMASSATIITSGNNTIIEEEHDYIYCYRCGAIIGEYEDETHEWYNVYSNTNYIIPTDKGYVPVCEYCFHK